MAMRMRMRIQPRSVARACACRWGDGKATIHQTVHPIPNEVAECANSEEKCEVRRRPPSGARCARPASGAARVVP
jgi:hypothetical protein